MFTINNSVFFILSISTHAQIIDNIDNDANSIETQNQGTASDFTHINNIVILIRFSDQPEYVTTDRMITANKAFNGTKAETNGCSLKSYIDYFSYGSLSVDSYFFPYTTNAQGDIIYFSYQDPHPIKYYNIYSETSNPIGYKPQELTERRDTLFQSAINSVKIQIETVFTKNELDTNSDEIMDNLTFICDVSNYYTIHHGDLLWPKKDTLSGNIFHGLTSATFNILHASHFGNFNDIGLVTNGNPNYKTLNHEFLHSMGTKDLYSNQSDIPVGMWDIMASTYGVPRLNEYDRRNVLGWGTEIPVIENTRSLTLQAVECINETGHGDTAFILKSLYSNTEFFVIEYHRRTGYENNLFIDSGGILVYRIDLTQNNNRSGAPYSMYIFRPNETSIQAGYLSSNLKNALLSPTKTGWSSLGKIKGTENIGFDNQTLYFGNGENSGIIINNIGSNNNDTISFNVTFSQLPHTPQSGSGTNYDPYIISYADQFEYIYYHSNKSYKLANDIDFSKCTYDFEPIQNFSGTLDGNGKKILNFTRNVSDNDISSLFNTTTNSAIIKNLTFVNPQITSSSSSGAAVLANTLNGKIENIHIIGGSIECTYQTSPTYAGSIAVASGTQLYNCSSSANIINNNYYGGGIVGYAKANANIIQCNYTGTITASIGGGLAGSFGHANIINSYCTGSINGDYIGGLIGHYTGGGNFIFSFCNGPINGDIAGGLCGIYLITPVTGPTYIEEVYWNTSLSNATSTIGFIDNELGFEDFSLPTGMIGIGIPSNLSFNSSEPQQLTVTTIPSNTSVTGTWGTTPFYSNVSVSSNGLVSPLYNGESPVTYTIPVGENQMILTTNASVSNLQNPPKTLITKVDSTYATLNGVVDRTTMNNGIYTSLKIINNTAMMPVRFLAETMDLTVTWDAISQNTIITNPNNGEYITLQIGSTNISKYSQDGTLITTATMPSATTVIESSTYAPARIIAEIFGFQVEYMEYADSEIFVITSNRSPAWTAEEIAAMCADASGKI